MWKKSCLTNLTDFYNEMTGSVNQGRGKDSAYLGSYSILIDKVME